MTLYVIVENNEVVNEQGFISCEEARDFAFGVLQGYANRHNTNNTDLVEIDKSELTASVLGRVVVQLNIQRVVI